MYLFLEISISLNCPSTVVTNQLMNCVLTAVTNNTVFDIRIDFGDNDIQYYSLNDNSVQILKTYNTNGTYMINATVINTGLYAYPIVNGKS